MSSIVIAGDTSGSVTLQAPAVSGSSVLSLPAVTDTVAGIAATQTLTNKTLVAPALGTPASGILTNATGLPATTGIVAGTADYKLFTNAGATAPEWAVGIKFIRFTQNMADASGNWVITGVGFKPSALILICWVQSTYASSVTVWTGSSVGGGMGSIGSVTPGQFAASGYSFSLYTTSMSTGQWGSGGTLDSDGFTLAHTKEGSPTGTANFEVLCYR